MTDGFWNRQHSLLPSPPMLKRPRSHYDMSASGLTGNEMHNYIARDDERAGYRMAKDTPTLGSAYDRYLQSGGQLTSFNSGEASAIGGYGLARDVGGLPGHSLADPAMMGRPGGRGPDLARNGRNISYGGQLPIDAISRSGPETVPLPPDASSTLYVEGLPSDSTKREVAHIFRPFVGYREVRLVTKESKHRGGDPLVLCFVDFASPACAATALNALQGYQVDELHPESSYLRLQFSRYPGARSGSGSGPRGKR